MRRHLSANRFIGLMTNFTWVPVYNRVEKIYLLLLARRAPVSEPIYRFDDKFHLGARVHKNEKRCLLRFFGVKLSTSPQNSLCCEWKLPQAVRSTSHTNSHLPRFAKSQIKIVKLNFHAKISNKSPRISSTFASIAILSHSSLTSAWANSSNFSSTSRIMP